MRTADILMETYESLVVNKVRSGLTILGIVIGIGSVIALVALGQGAQATITENIESLGSNMLMVRPGAMFGAGSRGVSSGRGSATTLTIDDADAIRDSLGSAKAVAPEVSSRYQVTARGTNTNTSVLGTTPEYPSVRNVQVQDGSFFVDQQVRSSAKVAVLGPTTRDDLFGEDADAVGQKIRINKIEFTVIGVTAAKGGSGFNSTDDVVYIPVSTAQRYLTGSDTVSTIDVEAVDQPSMAQLKSDITDLLLERHGIADPTSADFSILDQSDIIATATSVTGALTSLLAAIAAISLLVGGIGIMNMMLTTVTERTREIGLRKAIGAKRGEIITQFLAESVALTFIGGVVGVMAGAILSYSVGKFAGYPTAVTVMPVLLAFGVSAGIGIVFGYYPARRAARLNPIDALRYE